MFFRLDHMRRASNRYRIRWNAPRHHAPRANHTTRANLHTMQHYRVRTYPDVIADYDVAADELTQIVYVVARCEEANVGCEIDIIAQNNAVVTMIGWEKLYTSINRHVIACFDQPRKFDVNIIIEKHVFPASTQHEFESEVPNKGRHQIQKTLYKVNDVNERLIEDSHAHLICEK